MVNAEQKFSQFRPKLCRDIFCYLTSSQFSCFFFEILDCRHSVIYLFCVLASLSVYFKWEIIRGTDYSVDNVELLLRW